MSHLCRARGRTASRPRRLRAGSLRGCRSGSGWRCSTAWPGPRTGTAPPGSCRASAPPTPGTHNRNTILYCQTECCSHLQYLLDLGGGGGGLGPALVVPGVCLHQWRDDEAGAAEPRLAAALLQPLLVDGGVVGQVPAEAHLGRRGGVRAGHLAAEVEGGALGQLEEAGHGVRGPGRGRGVAHLQLEAAAGTISACASGQHLHQLVIMTVSCLCGDSPATRGAAQGDRHARDSSLKTMGLQIYVKRV